MNILIDIIVPLVLVAIGILLIVKGSDFFVSASIKISRILGISELVIGATIVSIGTTLPELVTSITAIVLELTQGGGGYSQISIGNSIGSICCNIGLVLAITMLSSTVYSDKRIYAKVGILGVSTAAVSIIFVFGKLQWWHGLILIPIFISFMAESLIGNRKEKKSGAVKMITPSALENESKIMKKGEKALLALSFIGGALVVSGGAYLTVENIEALCVNIHIPSQIVGATVVAVGTSLPELATSITAIRRGSSDIGLGNVIGANIVNGTLLLGTVALIAGNVEIDAFTATYGVAFMIIISAIGILPTVIRGKSSKLQGAVTLCAYLTLITLNVIYII